MKQILLIVILLTNFLSWIQAQLYQNNKSQHRFAQTYAGANLHYAPSAGQIYWDGGQSVFPHLFSPRLTVGGLHFWGHIDFQMNFSFSTPSKHTLDTNHRFSYNSGSDLSVRYYPWAVKFGTVRPYIGLSCHFVTFILESDLIGYRGDLYFKGAGIAGLSFAIKNFQVNAELNWIPFNKEEFYINHNQKATMELPSLYINLGLVYCFDVTLREEKGMKSGSTLALEEKLRTAKKLSSLSIGVGASTAIFTRAPHYNNGPRSTLPYHKTAFHFDLGLGYYLHRANMHIGLSYRSYRSSVESYELEHILRRESIAVEGYKFLLNYKGFVPFVGLTLSFERWLMGEFVGSQQQGDTKQTLKFSPGIILGWDILASPLETWVLRTNIRYYPFQAITDITGNSVHVDQFEFNFIQAVFYPQRMIAIPKAKKAAIKAGAIF